MRKHLDDIGRKNRPDNDYGKGRLPRGSKPHLKEFGVIKAETYDLDSTMSMLLYERLIEYKEAAKDFVDLEYRRYDFKGKACTQSELIDLMIEDLYAALADDYYMDSEEQKAEYRKIMDRVAGRLSVHSGDLDLQDLEAKDAAQQEAWEIWAKIQSSMWW